MSSKPFPTLTDLDVGGRRVLLRADLNVPMDEDYQVADPTRIESLLPTLNELSERGARTLILSHFGRPNGEPVDELSLGFIAMPLSEALGGVDIGVAGDCIGAGVEKLAADLAPGEFALLENLRFHAGEEANDPAFVEALAALGDVYVNDAFSVSHRAHASVVGLPAKLPHAAGRLLEAELGALDRALGNPERPVMAIVGGAKISTKLAVLGHLIDRVDLLAIGGAMANTFLAAQGHDVGASLTEPDMIDQAKDVIAKAADAGCELILPIDAVVAAALQPDVETQTVAVDAVPADQMILDIGPASADAIGNRLPECKTVVWNGPLGAFEVPPFDASSVLLARTTAMLTRANLLTSVAGGGDTIAALANAGALGGFSFVSTGGGAFLEWMEGKTLPGIAALTG